MTDDLLTSFCINESANLKTLAHATPDVLEAIAECALRQVPSLSSGVLAEAIARDAGLDVGSVGVVVDALWPLSMVQRRLDMDTETFIHDLEECLRTESRVGWSSEDAKVWDTVRPYISRLLSEESPVSTSAKAVDLLLEQPLVLSRARIVTDVRPIFNEEASELKGMLSFHTLILRCYEGSAPIKQIHVVLDASDLSNLYEQVVKAQHKERFMQSSLSAAGFVTVDTGMEEESEGDTDES
jgi:hypothetical protein